MTVTYDSSKFCIARCRPICDILIQIEIGTGSVVIWNWLLEERSYADERQVDTIETGVASGGADVLHFQVSKGVKNEEISYVWPSIGINGRISPLCVRHPFVVSFKKLHLLKNFASASARRQESSDPHRYVHYSVGVAACR